VVDKLLIRKAGKNQQYTPVVASAGAVDAGKVAALGADGKFDPSMYVPGTGIATRPVVASEAIGAGKLVNLYNNAGVLNARLADNSNGRVAHGFVKTAVASAGTAAVFDLDNVLDGLSGLTIGAEYFLGTAGSVITPALDAATATAGTIDQKIGVALSATEIDTDDYDYVVL
jgi:hypothetical protein